MAINSRRIKELVRISQESDSNILCDLLSQFETNGPALVRFMERQLATANFEELADGADNLARLCDLIGLLEATSLVCFIRSRAVNQQARLCSALIGSLEKTMQENYAELRAYISSLDEQNMNDQIQEMSENLVVKTAV